MEPYLSQIYMFGFNYPPEGWAACDGQMIPINQNPALYALVGDAFGGDGRTAFGLPDMRGRTPFCIGGPMNPYMGLAGGAETVAVTSSAMPTHTHAVLANTTEATTNEASGKVLAQSPAGKEFYNLNGDIPMSSAAVTASGSGQAHDNLQPSLVINFCMAISGAFPSRS